MAAAEELSSLPGFPTLGPGPGTLAMLKIFAAVLQCSDGLAATNALACANMALAGFDQVIPFDEVVDAAKAVAERMPREHRCTALGGLSDTPTSRSIEKRLAAARGCGSGGCGCG